jgi:hypothetical protein
MTQKEQARQGKSPFLSKDDDVEISTETKISLKAGIIGSMITALIVSIFSVLWVHQTDITLLKTNQTHVLLTLEKMSNIPEQMAVLSSKLTTISDDVKENGKVLIKHMEGTHK